MKIQILLAATMSITALSGLSVPAKAQIANDCAPMTLSTGASGCGDWNTSPTPSTSGGYSTCLSEAYQDFTGCLEQVPGAVFKGAVGGAVRGGATGAGVGAVGGGLGQASLCTLEYVGQRADCASTNNDEIGDQRSWLY